MIGRLVTCRALRHWASLAITLGVAIAPFPTHGVSAAMLSDDYIRTGFADLPHWQDDDHAKALGAFLRFCDSGTLLKSGPFQMAPKARQALCADAVTAFRQSENGDAAAARLFFETRFTPFRIDKRGFVTGYFEPEVEASRIKSKTYNTPLLRAPDGLTRISSSNRPKQWPAELSYGRQQDNRMFPMPDRGEIMSGALDKEKLELVYLKSPIDAFFIHVQGSARLKLEEGGTMRVGFAGKTGHPYTSIAKVLVERGEGTPDQLTMAGLKDWLRKNPKQRDALLRENRSFIFFREVVETSDHLGPIGAASLPLVPGRSLAVDLHKMSLGLPVYVEAGLSDIDGLQDLARLLIADDTGSAIKGLARGDLFIGSGDRAGQIAGDIRHGATMTILLPNALAGARRQD